MSGRWLMWFVAAAGGRVTARAVVADQHGGERLPGEMTADTLDELRAMLADGLMRWERTSVMSPEVVEVWD